MYSDHYSSVSAIFDASLTTSEKVIGFGVLGFVFPSAISTVNYVDSSSRSFDEQYLVR